MQRDMKAFVVPRYGKDGLRELAALYDAGSLRPVLDERTFSSDQTVGALAHVEQGKARGKVVITMDGTTPG